MPYPRVLVAGLRGGSGKTITTLGLIKALKNINIDITPFKKGPDYIDAGWLSWVSGRPCYNLDLFLMEKKDVISSFIMHGHRHRGVSIIEGNRGLYDGKDISGENSSAELSKLLRAPVIIVIDCFKVTRTVAAMLIGLSVFDREVLISGVVLNNIAGRRHESTISGVIRRYTDIPVLGVIPRMSEDILPQRHLGLITKDEYDELNRIDHFIDGIGKCLDREKILEIAKKAPPLDIPTCEKTYGKTLKEIKIGVIRDPAFQFYYPENIELIEERGAEVCYVNALEERELPKLDALYIGGGFPETNASLLAENKRFRESIKKAAEDGLPIYAECGGLMFLGEKLLMEGKIYPMCGVLPISFSMEKRPQAHGYTIVEVVSENIFFEKGITLKGHEFHYSRVIELRKEDVSFAFKMKRGEGIVDKMDGLCYRNIFATYTHLHALGSPQWVDGMIRAAKYRNIS
ncbi:MAG: hydrogenobyrinic acid a,c-diamide synthase (glutamine-hydrolyzing) [Nitrospirae bacterium]|nr:MAG: hydrogenobyrinic acid a,c-diamide synthase (glutamine-hydrolyzing) [Nitrospirota bacterium]